jgi:AcrR family transcriptional regulator
MGHGTVVKRPGGRTADVTARIHQAILDIIVEDGVAACTFSAVAERAKVERSTLYRRFPDRWDAIIEAVMHVAGGEVMPDLTGSFPDDLRSVLRKLVETLESPLGPAVLAIAAELRAGSGSDYSRAYFDQRMAQLAPMFDAAVERGELAPDVDREALFTVAAGAIYFRTFIAARGVDDDFIDMVVGLVCWQYCSPSVAAKLSLPGRLA